LQESIFVSCSCYLGYRKILHLSFTKTNHLQSDMYTSISKVPTLKLFKLLNTLFNILQ